MNGAYLRQMRKKHGLTQWEVARAVGKTQGWLSVLEAGYRDLPEEKLLEIAGTIKALSGRTCLG